VRPLEVLVSAVRALRLIDEDVGENVVAADADGLMLRSRRRGEGRGGGERGGRRERRRRCAKRVLGRIDIAT